MIIRQGASGCIIVELKEEKKLYAFLCQDLGKRCILRQKLDDALEAMQESLALNDSDGWTYAYIGNIYYKKQQYHIALDWFEKASLHLEQCASPFLGVGDAYRALGNDKQAERYYRKALEISPTNKSVLKRFNKFVLAKVA